MVSAKHCTRLVHTITSNKSVQHCQSAPIIDHHELNTPMNMNYPDYDRQDYFVIIWLLVHSSSAGLQYDPRTEIDIFDLPILSFLSIVDAQSNFTKFLWLVGHDEALVTLLMFLSSSWSKAPVLDSIMTHRTEIETFNLPILSFLSVLGQDSTFFKFMQQLEQS